MSIVTKNGDKGITSLFGGKKISKADPLIDAYGTIDELNSVLGMIRTQLNHRDEKTDLLSIQKDLYQIMSYLAGGKVDLKYLESRLKSIEEKIDQKEKVLPKINHFLIPGDNPISAWFHIARTICRRSERKVVALKPILESNVVKYLNRLSDLLFILARQYGEDREYFNN